MDELRALDPMLKSLARQAATRAQLLSHVDDLAQSARIAAWECLARYDARYGVPLAAYVRETAEYALKDAAQEIKHPGADRDALGVFGRCVADADGDPYRAERLCQVTPEAGKRLSAERAQSARLAWLGTRSLDTPHGATAVAQETAEEAEPTTRQRRNAEVLDIALAGLSPLRREVIKARLGMGGYPADLSPLEVPAAVSHALGGVALSVTVTTDAYRKGLRQLRNESVAWLALA